ncbi:MAG TPA: SURF1 family protein [Steroidobacteraceae bacterium]
MTRFAPTAGMTLLTLVLCALCVRLGFWQWHRWVQSDAAWTRFARGADAVQPLGARALEEVTLFQRVSVTGRLDGQHQFLLDNLSYRGRPGYQVLTPLERCGGGVLLVDRGWVPFTGARSRLPDVTVSDAASVGLSGRVADLPAAGLASGRAPPDPLDPWPRVTSFPRAAELARALGVPLGERILLLDPGAPHGYLRDWLPPGLAPLRHLSYAIQWWCFAALALVVWGILSVRRARRAPAPQ